MTGHTLLGGFRLPCDGGRFCHPQSLGNLYQPRGLAPHRRCDHRSHSVLLFVASPSACTDKQGVDDSGPGLKNIFDILVDRSLVWL